MATQTIQIPKIEKREVQVKKTRCSCNICRYSWISILDTIPKQCPKCKNMRWNLESKK